MGGSEVEKKVTLLFQIWKTKVVGPPPHTQFPRAAVTRRCLPPAAAGTPFVRLPNCGSVTVTVGVNVDSCPSGCDQRGPRFDNITCRTLTYAVLTFGLSKSFTSFALSRLGLCLAGFGFLWLLLHSLLCSSETGKYWAKVKTKISRILMPMPTFCARILCVVVL